ncbi:glycosyltransferase involved in cell wall biosynthesis [Arcanobacterium pluranimalium]|uniref:glycosyltransferase n=1 Tax=Arcanobacterium pluranimalium TaxID=108028 RepID=UPI00195A9AA1|nr:glycosyltransferase [Arcanobacterium pluranimalium]MBM7824611.1 glycosyltransferase involved in cell wall biosynthesis [Arcanobacterium pluranimalium]
MDFSTPLVSIIIPTFNIGEAIHGNLLSIADSAHDPRFEIIYVDDCSTDQTFTTINNYARNIPNWHIYSMPVNTGSPSAPRNFGISKAKGTYIYLLDGDDKIDLSSLSEVAEQARYSQSDVVRSPLRIEKYREPAQIVDRLPVQFHNVDNKIDLLSAFVTYQSMGSMALIRRGLIETHKIVFDESCRMGEDLRFMSDIMVAAKNISYFDEPVFTYVQGQPDRLSATSVMTGREMREFAQSWTYSHENYLRAGVSFLRLHGVGTVSYGVKQMIKRFVTFNTNDFLIFADFVDKYWSILSTLSFDERVSEILTAAHSREEDAFRSVLHPRLLIAGHDLKFIRGAQPYLEKHFNIHYDEWINEREHNSEKSLDELKWAEVIWVEWMTAASVWFSQRVSKSQTLIVRAHFYEITRNSGFELDRSKVDAIIAIALHTYEDLIERFKFSRELVRLIPNFYDTTQYRVEPDQNKKFRLALVGSVPARKGLARAYDILARLRQLDARYTLTIFGKQPKDFGWIAGDPKERAYFHACEVFAHENNLNSAITYEGWVNTKDRLGEYGFVLSVSDFEGSHVSPGEAFCAENTGIFLAWRGVEFVYPSDFIFSDIDSIVSYIHSSHANTEIVEKKILDTKEFIQKNQDVSVFASAVIDLVNELLLRK